MNRFQGSVVHLYLMVVIGSLLLATGCSEEEQPSAPPASSPAASDTQDTPRQPNARLPFAKAVVRKSRPLRDMDWFEDVAGQLGVDFSYQDGSNAGLYQLIESVGGGVAVFDFDLDGWQDIYITGGGNLARDHQQIKLTGRSGALYRNGFGEEMPNCTRASGVAESPHYTHGVTVGDIDADGFPDLVVAGYGGVQVWMNHGDGTFADEAISLGVDSSGWNVTPAAGDINGDGLTDLYLVTYSDWTPDLDRVCLNDQKLRDICGPTLFPGSRDQLFLNTGTGFRNATDEAQLIPANRGLGVVVSDLDGNGHLDVVVVNDVEENQLYSNSGGFPLMEKGVLGGIAYSSSGQREGSMGVDLGDYDADGSPDLWYTNYSGQDNSLMRNINGTGFLHTERIQGLAGVSRPLVGFGTGFGDFDCDGWPDLYVVNGHVAYDRLDGPYFQPAQLFRNDSGQRFRDVTEQGGPYFEHNRSARGSACVDIDNDGAMDLLVVHQNEPLAILKNRHHAAHHLRLNLVGVSAERSAVGARVIVKADDKACTQWRISGGSYASHKDSRLMFVLPDDSPVSVQVDWLGGQSETFESVRPGSHVVVQSHGIYGDVP